MERPRERRSKGDPREHLFGSDHVATCRVRVFVMLTHFGRWLQSIYDDVFCLYNSDGIEQASTITWCRANFTTCGLWVAGIESQY